jgi:hypothetical protein
MQKRLPKTATRADAHHSHAARYQSKAARPYEAGQHDSAAPGPCGAARGNESQLLRSD